jgi:hypothetical protein
MSHPTSKPKTKWWRLALFIPLAPVLLVVVLLWLMFFLVSTVWLHIVIWAWWCFRGRDILFVYSDSPIWHGYIEQQVLPRLGERAVVLNLSHLTRWRFSLARVAFYHFGGWRAFNPLAVVFRPFRRTRKFRFLQPFRDFKHGHPEALYQMESEFFGLIGVHRPYPSA